MLSYDDFADLCDNVDIDDKTKGKICDYLLESGSCDGDEDRKLALLAWLIDNGNSDNPSDIDDGGYGDNTFKSGRCEYLVLTDSEADEACADRIKDSLWAFNASFLSGETGIDDSVFEALADKCEGANEPILSIIKGSCGIDSFVESAASADGRGHFLSSYDGSEDEYGDYYIYRIN